MKRLGKFVYEEITSADKCDIDDAIKYLQNLKSKYAIEGDCLFDFSEFDGLEIEVWIPESDEKWEKRKANRIEDLKKELKELESDG